ncbi:MAG TPA: hypothetical protein PK156_31620 [Polyangium sp.]|nr:hypothetical protein [Polyangium sp.]
MKNTSFLISVLVGSLVGCSGASQDSTTSGANPTPTVTVPAQTAEPANGTKVGDNQPPPAETSKPSEPLALQQCSEESRKAQNCATISKPVCGEVDTGLRCVRAPCPSMAMQTFDNACTACMNKNVRGYYAASCESMPKQAPQPSNPAQ